MLLLNAAVAAAAAGSPSEVEPCAIAKADALSSITSYTTPSGSSDAGDAFFKGVFECMQPNNRVTAVGHSLQPGVQLAAAAPVDMGWGGFSALTTKLIQKYVPNFGDDAIYAKLITVGKGKAADHAKPSMLLGGSLMELSTYRGAMASSIEGLLSEAQSRDPSVAGKVATFVQRYACDEPKIHQAWYTAAKINPGIALFREDIADRLSRLADRHIADRETRVKASGAEACFRALGNTSSTLPYRPVKEPSLLQLAAERIWNA